MPVTVRVLGPVELVVDGAVRPQPPLERSLLTILAANAGRVVSVERLITGLWDEHAPAGARNRVQALVAAVRRAIPPHLLVTRAPGYLLDGQVTLDAVEFAGEIELASAHRRAGVPHQALDLLDRALLRWRGDAFADVSSSLIEVDRIQLHELREHAREERFETKLDLGQHHEVLPELIRMVTDQPLRTRLRGQLMVALQQCGRTAEALAVYGDGAQILAEEHGLDPAEDLRRLHLRILTEHEFVGSAPAAPVKPLQLPMLVGDFVGRTQELDYLRSLLTDAPDLPGAARIVIVTGLPGVGKTTLALRAGHEHRHCFPDGALYADLRARPDATAVLGAFLRALGVTGSSIPDDTTERSALYRSILADRRVLVLLDSATSEELVRPLLPPEPSCALITSVAGLPGIAGSHRLPLAGLGLEDGLALLARLAGADRVNQELPAAAQVVESCGGLPLALRVAGMRLAHHEVVPIARLRARLLDERSRLDELALGDLDVRSSLAVGVASLSTDAARLLTVLSHTPLHSYGGWDERYQPAFEELCRAQMLTADSHGRLRLHDLVRLHVRELTELHEEHLLDWYRSLLAQTRRAAAALPCRMMPMDVVDPLGMETADAMLWFIDEQDNLLAAAADALARGYTALAGGLISAMTNFAIMRAGDVPDWEPAARAVLVAHDNGGGLPQQLELSLRLGVGTKLRLADHAAESLPLFRRVYHVARSGGFPRHRLIAITSWALAARHVGWVRRSDAAFRVMVSLCANQGEQSIEVGYSMLALGVRLSQHRHTAPLACAALNEAEDVLRSHQDWWGCAVALEAVGMIHQQRGASEQATTYLRRAITGYRAVGDRLGVTVVEQALAAVHLSLGQLAQARALLDHTIPAFAQMRYPWGEGTSRRLLGKLHLERGDPVEATVELDHAVELLRGLDKPLALARAQSMLARALFATGAPSAVQVGEQALAVLDQFASYDAAELRDLLTIWRTAGFRSVTTSDPQE